MLYSMIASLDILTIALAILIGFIDDKLGPQAYRIENQLVYVYDKYQCPSYCGVKHMHYIKHDNPNSVGTRLSKKKLEKLKLQHGYR